MPTTKLDGGFVEAEAAYSNAAKAELDKDLDRAFRLYIKAAEAFLHLSQLTADPNLRTTCQSHASKALHRAEKIKAVRSDLTPVAKDSFAEPEQLAVLRKSSVVNNTRVPLWDEDPETFPDDTSQPRLCAEQLEQAAIWRRCRAAATPSICRIVQHIVADCSVCASVAVCVNHNLRFGSKVVARTCAATSAGLPTRRAGRALVAVPHAADGSPAEAADGRYALRMLFNGAYHRFPTDPDGSLLCMSTGSSASSGPRSWRKPNSNTDLHALTGWIPEYIDMRRAAFQRERMWRRIVDGFAKEIAVPSWSLTALLPAHCYAVIDVQDTGGDRHMSVLDTWIHGRPSAAEDDASPATAANEQAAEKSHMRLFDGVYLSWDPGIFQHQLSFHGSWQSKYLEGGDHSSHVRLLLKTPGNRILGHDEEVWVLLTRHVADTRRKEEFIALLVKDGSEPSEDVDALVLKGEYTDSVHILVRAHMRAAINALSIVSSYDGNFDGVGFTVTVYSHLPLEWKKQCPKPLFTKQLDGVFTSKNAGGNQTFPSFFVNPQYHLRIHPASQPLPSNPSAKARAAIAVKGSRKTPMNVMAVWSQGERITEMGHNDVAFTSGPYSYGYARARCAALPVGEYTVIV
ncbi:hypothetical protein B0H21DRAFT_768435, partial [Amylocystis lapponica]